MDEDRKVSPLSLDAVPHPVNTTAISNLGKFYEMFNEIFHYKDILTLDREKKWNTDKNSLLWRFGDDEENHSDDDGIDNVLNQCVRHFRKVYRSTFRGYSYVSLKKLQDTQKIAMSEAMQIMEDMKNPEKVDNQVLLNLKEQLTLEESWIANVNQLKRQEKFEELKAETEETFKMKVARELPILLKKARVEYYEEEDLSEQIETLKYACIDDMESQIPFREEEEENGGIASVTADLVAKLNERFISALYEENKIRKEIVQSKMKTMVQDSISQYSVKLKAAITENFNIDEDQISLTHHNFVNELLPDFTNMGTPLSRTEHMQHFNDQVKLAFGEIVRVNHKDGQDALTKCLEESKSKLEAELPEIFKKHSVPVRDICSVRSVVIHSLEETVEKLKKSNETNLQSILLCTKSSEEKKREEAGMIVTELQDEYKKKWEHYTQKDNPYWELKSEASYNRKWHEETKNDLCKLLETRIMKKMGTSAELVEEQRKILVQFSDSIFREETGQSLGKTVYDLFCQELSNFKWTMSKYITFQNADISTVRSLPPLVFQLTPGHIRLGMMVNAEPALLKNEDNDGWTEANIGLTEWDSFLHGKMLDTERHRRTRWHRKSDYDTVEYNITDYLIKDEWHLYTDCPIAFSYSPWKRQINFRGKQVILTYELLLALLFRKLKENVEAKMKGKVTTTLITVPDWFISSQRARVKDAAKVAGFSKVGLVNQAAAAAYASVANVNDSPDYIIVFSQYDTMSVYITLYEIVSNKLVGKEVRLLRRESVRLECKEDDDFEGGVTAVRNCCKEILSDDRVKCFAKIALTVNTVSPVDARMQTQILKRVAAEMMGVLRIEFNDVKEVVVKGAVMLAQNMDQVGIRIRDKLHYGVKQRNHQHFRSEKKKVYSSHELLPCQGESKVVVRKLHRGETQVVFSQSYEDYAVGYLQVKSVLPDDVVGVRLKVNHEGIIEFVGIEKTTMGCPSTDTDTSGTWNTPQLTQKEITEQTLLLDEVMITVPRPPKVEDNEGGCCCLIRKSGGKDVEAKELGHPIASVA